MGKKCENFSVNLSAYFDEELEGEELAELEQHLEGCETCASSLDQMQRLSIAIHRVSKSSPGKVPLFDEIMKRLAEEEESSGKTKKPEIFIS